jgi:sugar transferase (PEP-CTERM system associated)
MVGLYLRTVGARAMIHLFSHYVPARLVLLAALESLLLIVAIYAGVSLHLASAGAPFSGATDALPAEVGLLFVLGMIILLASMGLYQPSLWGNRRSVAIRITASFLLGLLLVQLTSYALQAPHTDTVAMASILGVALAGGVALRAAIHEWSSAAAFKSRILVLGTGSRASKLEERVQLNPHHEVVGYVPLQSNKHYVPESELLTFREGDSLLSLVDKYGIDQIVIAVRDRRGGGLPIEQLLECRARGVKVVEMPTFFEREYRQLLLESLNHSWMIFGGGFRRDYVSSLVKRVFDLLASLMLLFVCWPIMAVAALCIYLESGAPVLFRQERVGKDGHAFSLLKFRSMRNDAEADGIPQWAGANDDRVTRTGRFMRKLRIDELPQLFNVIRGEMSFVGPRPERPFFVDQLSQQIPYYALRHSVRPGITGWAQVRYPYGATVDDAVEKLQYDLYYVKNHSLFLDLMILLSTVEVVLWGKGAR